MKITTTLKDVLDVLKLKILNDITPVRSEDYKLQEDKINDIHSRLLKKGI